jgi:hypothetical protein
MNIFEEYDKFEEAAVKHGWSKDWQGIPVIFLAAKIEKVV